MVCVLVDKNPKERNRYCISANDPLPVHQEEAAKPIETHIEATHLVRVLAIHLRDKIHGHNKQGLVLSSWSHVSTAAGSGTTSASSLN